MDSLETLDDKNLVLVNRDFSAIRQLNEPFIAVVINDDAVTMTFPREQEFTKCSNQIGAVIFVCVHNSKVFMRWYAIGSDRIPPQVSYSKVN